MRPAGGADVTILYRRSREEMPAIASEIEDALEEGVELILLAAPVRLERDADGVLTAVVVQRMSLGPPDSSGRRSPVPVPVPNFSLPADTVIAAVSQVPMLDGLESLDHDGNWLVPDPLGGALDPVSRREAMPSIPGLPVKRSSRAGMRRRRCMPGCVALPNPDRLRGTGISRNQR